LDLSLARQTHGYFIQPENLLTITVPTGLPPKATFKGEFSGTFASYHKTSWESVAKILEENCIRPASWATNELGIPMQFPCYRFFGYSCEITDPDDLKHWPIKICTSKLYKIGKGQNPSGIIATCKTPKLIRVQSAGNDQLQCLCALQGIARGKDAATAMNSRCASVSYVASTHPVFQTLITRAPIPDRGSTSSIAGDAPEPPLTSTLTVPPTTEVATTEPLWNLLLLPIIEPEFMTTRRPILTPVKLVAVTTTGNLILLGIKTGKIDCRSQHSSHQEGRSREYHREGSSGYYSSHRDSDRSYW
jgi:hypothetical protein